MAGLAILHPAPAAASDDFGYVYTAETEEAGETELTLWATDRRGKEPGHYAAQDYWLEVEHGFTDRFQASIYANFAGHHVRNAERAFEPVDREFAFQGFSAEFIYALREPTHGRVGFALYAEPGWSRIHKVSGEKSTEYELELKAIVQKNSAADRLVWAANLTLEPEWEHEHRELASAPDEPDWEKELNLEVATGLAYNVAPKWWLGLEGRYHSVYPDWTHGLHRENYAVYAGPTVRYDGGEWSISATWLPQLYGSPNQPGSSLEFDDHEKRELRVKLSVEF
ncbi:MAG TPA: DUF6662 family protein [Dehalococcoidia bacterium]|nr:DUF6662 family protein [Dehalococcoidia bacterium]